MANDITPIRELKALITEYRSHPEYKDVYVESTLDKSFYAYHLKMQGKYLRFITIQTVIISNSDLQAAGYNEDCERDKIIYLIQRLQEENIGKNVYGIIDKDFLIFTRGQLPKFSNLLFTDYSCKEMFFFTDETIKAVYEQEMLKVSAKIIQLIMLEQLKLSGIQIIKEKENWGISDIEFKKKHFKISRDSFEFLYDDYFESFIQQNRILYRDKEKNKKKCDDFQKELMKHEIKDCIRGHDFIKFLLRYLKSNNCNSYTEETLSNLYQTGVTPDVMMNTKLVKKLLTL